MMEAIDLRNTKIAIKATTNNTKKQMRSFLGPMHGHRLLEDKNTKYLYYGPNLTPHVLQDICDNLNSYCIAHKLPFRICTDFTTNTLYKYPVEKNLTDILIDTLWTPVTEKLPPENEEVRITYIGFTDKKPRANKTATYKDGIWYYGSGNDHGWLKVKMPVTAWKPLENIPYSKVPETALEEIKEYSRLEDIDEP